MGVTFTERTVAVPAHRWKCTDNMNSYYKFLTDSTSGGGDPSSLSASEDGTVLSSAPGIRVRDAGYDLKTIVGGYHDVATKIKYKVPSTGTVLTDAQMDHIRSVTNEVAPDTAIYCTEVRHRASRSLELPPPRLTIRTPVPRIVIRCHYAHAE